MKLRAKVKRITGATKNYEGRIEEGRIVRGAELPAPVFVEIAETEGGFLLLYFDSNGEYITDAWHQTLEDAKAGAKFAFDIDEADWMDISIM